MRPCPDARSPLAPSAAAAGMIRAVFINLDRAADRRGFMEDQAARLGLPAERFPAIEAGTISEADARRLGRSWERPLTMAELGCFLSHHALWSRVAAGAEPMLVLEDDVALSPRLAALLPMLGAVRDVEFLNLESFDRRRFVVRGGRPIGEGLGLVRVMRDKSGSAAYVLWPDGARKLLARAERGAAPVDAFLHGFKALSSFQVEPALAMQVHLLERRGLRLPIQVATSIQAPRARLPLTLGNLPFHARRLATQARLAGEHLMRLTGRRAYRRVDIVEADFADLADRHSRS